MYRVACSLASGQWASIPVQPRTGNSYGPWGHLEPEELFEGGDGYGKWGIDERYYAKYGLGWSLVAAPFCALGMMLANITDAPEGFITRIAVMFLNPLLTAAGCVALYYLARRIYQRSFSVMLALIYGVCTIAWYYAKSAFNEPLVVLLILVAILAIEGKQFVWAGIVLGYTLLTRQTLIFAIIPIVIWALIRIRREDRETFYRAIALLMIPLVAGQGITWLYNYLRFGNLFEYGYQTAGWDTPIFLGFYGLLFSPGKGLFVYSPILILGVVGLAKIPRRDLFWLFVAVIICHLIPHAIYTDWSGGGGWGPRLLLPVVPFLVFPAGYVIESWQSRSIGKLGLVLLVAVSLVIELLGISVNWVRHLQRVYDETSMPEIYFNRVHFSWPDSPILGQFQSLREVSGILQNPDSRANLNEIAHSELKTELMDSQSLAMQLLSFNVPDFWFVYLTLFRAPFSIILLFICCFVSIVLFSGFKLKHI